MPHRPGLPGDGDPTNDLTLAARQPHIEPEKGTGKGDITDYQILCVAGRGRAWGFQRKGRFPG